MTTVFRTSANGEITIEYTENLEFQGDSTLSFKVDVPETAEVNVDLEYELSSEGRLTSRYHFTPHLTCCLPRLAVIALKATLPPI